MNSERFQRSRGRLLSPLPILFLTVFIDMVGFGIVVPVLPLYTERFGASPFTTGLLLAVYSGMGFIFSPVVGALSDRIGRRSILLLSTIGQATGFFIMGAATTLLWLFIARTIDGIFGANVSATQAYVADVTPPQDRSRALGLLGAAFGLGFICGPMLGGVLSLISLSAPFYFAGALAAANAVLIFFILPESLPLENRSGLNRETFVTLFREGRGRVIVPLMAAYFFIMAGFSIMTAFFAIFTEDRFGYNASANGYIFAGVGVISVIVQGAMIGRLIKNFTEKGIALTGVALLACSLFALPLVQTLTTLLLVSTGIAVGNSFINPTMNGLVSRSVNKYWQGRVLGLMQACASLGRFFGPLIGGWFLVFNPRRTLDFGKAPFWIGGALLIVSFVLTTMVSTRRSDTRETALPSEA
ncbi:MAG TPA: MFS transporter [Chthoniobacterales bacterium]|jgi:DHA1 family tetracycline resistance protein-like MFS transporter|nr:MFS transporter [Chthoniobacterales bacterium]